jgi:prephenate dehydratase
MPDRPKVIAYQGEPGANSHIACLDVYPEWRPLPCATFEDAFAAIRDGAAGLGNESNKTTGAGGGDATSRRIPM